MSAVQVRLAEPGDNDQLIALTLACPMQGDIGLCMDRSPNFFALSALEGDRFRVGVALNDKGQIVGSIAVAVREVWLNEKPTTIVYASDMKVHPDYRDRKHADALQRWGAERAVEMCGRNVSILSTVLGGNAAMEARYRGPRGLHQQTKIATTRAHTIFLLWKRSPPKVPGIAVRPAEERDLDAMGELWSAIGGKRQFAFTYGADAIRSWLKRAPSLSIADYWVAYDQDGRLVGFCGFWDQEPLKHMRVTRYSSSLRRVRTLFNLAAPLFGATKLPAEGDTLRYVTAVNVCVPGSRPDVFRAIVLAAYGELRKKPYSFMTIGLDVKDPLAGGLDGLLAQPTDIRVTKHQWGAFYGTDLDVQLRRRGIKTLVLGGIATNFGVESTAEQAWERGYAVVVAEDATSSVSAEMHAFSIGSMLPRLSRIVKAGEIHLARAD